MTRNHAALSMLGLFALLLAISFIADSHNAEAIPAFARKYRMSCTTCYNPVPRLKAYGDEFAGNGFVLADQDAPRYFVESGDDNLSLIRDFPIAVRMDGYLKYDSATDRDLDLTAPYLLKLLSGGSLGYDFAYYFYFYMSERGEVVGVEDCYLMYNNVGGIDFDIYLGQFQVSDPLFKRELRLTYEDYQIYKTKVGDSQIALAYDRGIMLTLGIENGPDLIAEIVNGNGLAEADEQRVYDSDKYKSFVGRISWDVNDYLRVGGFGYYGKEGVGQTSEVWLAGPDVSITDGKYLELNVQYVERRDSNPLFLPCYQFCDQIEDVETSGGFAELVLTPDGDRSKWYAVALFNWLEVDPSKHVSGAPYYELFQKYSSISAQIGYLLRTNLRLVTEGIYDIETEEYRHVIGFVSAF